MPTGRIRFLEQTSPQATTICEIAFVLISAAMSPNRIAVGLNQFGTCLTTHV